MRSLHSVYILLLATGFFFSTLQAAEFAIYVSPQGNDAWSGLSPEPLASTADGPFATLEAARDKIRQIKKQGDLRTPITVYLRQGTYRRQSPFLLESQDSGSPCCPIVYRAYPGELPIISGGRALQGWAQSDSNRWILHIKDPDLAHGEFRQLFIDGQRRQRSRIPNRGWLRIAENPNLPAETHYATPMDSFRFAAGDLSSHWSNLQDVEIVILHFWVDTHLPIRAIDDSARLVYLAKQSRRKFTDDFSERGARYSVENVLEGMDQAGEWYHDRMSGKLFYLAETGERPDLSETRVARLPTLWIFQGEPLTKHWVENIHLDGIVFRHTEWHPDKTEAVDVQAAAIVPAALQFIGSRNCTIQNSVWENIGTYGIDISVGCRDITIHHNTLQDLGAGGIKINGGDAQADSSLLTHHIRIMDNQITAIGRVHHSAVGILLQNSGYTTLAHNRISDTFYTAISAGWVWGYKPSVSHHNEIAYNDLYDIGQEVLSDMGGIYLLGVAPGTRVHHNRIHDITAHGYGGWGIYTDEGSSDVLIENNLVYRTKHGGFHQHYGRDNQVRNNIFALAQNNQLERSREEDHQSFTFQHNIVFWSQGELLGKNWENQHFVFKNNLYCCSTCDSIDFAGHSFAQWQELGQDRQSLIADPEFVDPENGCFELKPNSPAFRIGFEPFDLSTVGPRPLKPSHYSDSSAPPRED